MRSIKLGATLATLLAFAGLSVAPARAGVSANELRCSAGGGFGFLVASNRKLSCVYYRPDGIVEFYVGSTTRIGFDLGPTNAVRLAFAVVGARPAAPGTLQGDFGGPGFGATVLNGVGADALVGPGGALVPIKNAYLTGININAGLGLLHLDYAGMEPRR